MVVPCSTWPVRVSIHAPRVGSDAVGSRRHARAVSFNPRSPRGERPLLHRRVDDRSFCFNPRSPRGERRCITGLESAHSGVSIHAPRVGSDPRQDRSNCYRESFQSTLPAWGATSLVARSPSRLIVSIHAPRVGSDDIGWQTRRVGNLFQSTLPAWGATPDEPTVTLFDAFQSTLPAWGATTPVLRVLFFHQGFNPRSPRGERQR